MKNKGFTLIEILVVIVLFAILGTVGTNLFSSTIRGSNKAFIISEIKQNGSNILAMMERYIRNSEEISVTPATACDNATELSSITIKNFDNSSTIFTFNGNEITFTTINNGTTTNILNSNAIILENITDSPYFICQKENLTNIPVAIVIHFVLKEAANTTSSDQKASISFDTIVAIRNK